MDEEQVPVEDEPEEMLVMAMPRRELYGVQGFTVAIELPVIESLADEHWFALPVAIEADIDAKAVRLGLVVTRGDEVLISEDGVVLHSIDVPPEVSLLGTGLRGLREFARQACSEMLALPRVPAVELWGYLNLDAEDALRPFFFAVYRARVSAEVEAPGGLAFVTRHRAGALGLDPASRALFEGWPAGGRQGYGRHD